MGRTQSGDVAFQTNTDCRGPRQLPACQDLVLGGGGGRGCCRAHGQGRTGPCAENSDTYKAGGPRDKPHGLKGKRSREALQRKQTFQLGALSTEDYIMQTCEGGCRRYRDVMQNNDDVIIKSNI